MLLCMTLVVAGHWLWLVRKMLMSKNMLMAKNMWMAKKMRMAKSMWMDRKMLMLRKICSPCLKEYARDLVMMMMMNR